MKHARLLSFGLAFAVTASSSTAHDTIAAATRRHAPKSWFTPEQKAFIAAKCGVDIDSNHRNLNIQNDVMTCPDGRTVSDPYVKVMSADISRRANAYVAEVMKDVDVQRAMALATGDQVRKAIADARIDARVAEAMAHADIARKTSAEVRRALAEANIDQQVRDALAQADVARETAKRVRESLAKSGLSDTH